MSPKTKNNANENRNLIFNTHNFNAGEKARSARGTSEKKQSSAVCFVIPKGKEQNIAENRKNANKNRNRF